MANVAASIAAELMVPVVSAPSCAHKLGVVHRDLKPENVMKVFGGKNPSL